MSSNKSIQNIFLNAYLKFTQTLYDREFTLDKIKEAEVIKNDKLLQNFVDLLRNHYDTNSIGATFIYKYFVFQYEFWINLDFDQRFAKRVPLSWIVGKKALDRFLNNPYKDLTKAYGVIKSFGIHQSHIELDRHIPNVIDLNTSEENAKRLFFNKEQGFILCNESTTLFNDKSSLCNACNFNTQCKSQLQLQYPRIFIARGYKPQYEPNRVRRVA